MIVALLLAGCTSASQSPNLYSTAAVPTTASATAPSTTAAAPNLNAGPTAIADGDCPFIATTTAAADVGMRLARSTVIARAGKPIGCQFFAVQGQSYDQSEHLPGPNQPAIEITAARYGSELAANNAMVEQSRVDKKAYTSLLNGTIPGVSYQITFDPVDGPGQDWAYAYLAGPGQTTVVTVKIAMTNPALNARAVAADLKL
jgi:hypothetical protein